MPGGGQAEAAPASAAAGAVRERAAAKLNLDLLVTGRRVDGYHELDSVVVFADDLADELTLAPAAGLRLDARGPFAADLPPAEGNIALRAARRLAEAAGLPARARIELQKRLPVAAGVGGGSADAAAVLRGLRRLWRVPLDDAGLRRVGLGLGADVPVCLPGRAARMRGIGELLEPLDEAPELHLVLVNPRRPLATAAVFAGLGAHRSDGRAEDPPVARAPTAWLDWLRRTRNDLEAPARRLLPVVGEVLAALAADPGCRLARMSGSGPTCFGVFEGGEAARGAAGRIAAARPRWWVVPCRTAAGAP
jgi:4-diphosphocytidyl-2-C-methyl-D-erythritol kinase